MRVAHDRLGLGFRVLRVIGVAEGDSGVRGGGLGVREGCS
jgi:hypothetical protein